jgi:diaminopimelate epimerase
MGSMEVDFAKGHGTGNDFVIVPDLQGRLDLTEEQVRFLCDRHRGIGGDGVLRVVRTSCQPDFTGLADRAEFFMDYRNADGSAAQMCGNGVRVFARYLREQGLIESTDLTIATRDGLRAVHVNDDATMTVDMGQATTPRVRAMPVVEVGDHAWPAVGVLVPNPHAVVFVDDLADAGDLRAAPVVVPPAVFPDGVNVEFVVAHSPTHASMRVFERGVGETLSCGTGACAVAWAMSRRDGQAGAGSIRIDVQGGTVHVSQTPTGHLLLTGPAEIVARGTVNLPVR